MADAVRYADSRAGTIGFAVVDESGRLHGYHARVPAYSASLLKPLLLVAYLRRPTVRDRALTTTERDMLTPMIRRSDSTNVPRLIGIVGEQRLKKIARKAGMGHFALHMPHWGASETTPRGQAVLFRRVDRLVPSRHRAYAMRLLATIVPSQRWGVGRVPHDGWHLYFKGGWSTGTGFVDHQVALYRAGGERLSVALFTRFDPDHQYGKRTLRGLAARLRRGVARPGRRIPRVRRATFAGGYAATASGDCVAVTIRPPDGEARAFASGADSCSGFRLASAGAEALWSWPEAGGTRLAAASYAGAGVTDLGAFDSSNALGPLAGKGGMLAYAHGDEVSILGGSVCPVPASALAVGGGSLAAAAGSTIRVLDPATCSVRRSVHVNGTVLAVALDGSVLALLVSGPAGRRWLQRVQLSSGAKLGRKSLAAGTLPELALRGSWILYRTPHALRALSNGSGRSWTVWRPARGPVAAGLAGRRIVWVENESDAARLWSLRLPRT
jgi:Beta-lactamase enzyme family